MNTEIKIFYDERKVIVSAQALEKIKYLTREDEIYFNTKKPLSTEMDIRVFYERMERIIQRSLISLKFLPSKDNEINYNTDLIHSLAQKYNELFPEEVREDDSIYRDETRLNELLNTIYQMKIEEKNFFLMRNLISARNDCLKNMKYFVSDEIISKFNEEYEQAIQDKDVSKMSDMLNYVQQSVLQEWENYFADANEMTDDNFTFIGHSTSSTKFDKDFYSNYVSASLFNQDLTDTYRSGYGFIFAPKNIVGAKSQDMHVNNYVQDEDMLLNYSIVKKIDHPKKVIDECLKLKQENAENNIDEKVYSEIILSEFEPIGIFCFTDGTKNLNRNYRCAQQLQESFPHLKIHNFDIMKKKKGTELAKMKLALINNLRRLFTNYNFEINMDMLSKYDYFFKEYEKLKQNPDYTESEIETIFRNNEKMLSVFNTSPEDLFNGSYDEKQRKYILGKNINYNIDNILKGKAKAFTLNDLKKLYPYKDKLNSIFDGLSEFVDLVSKIEITDEMMREINQNESINFYTIIRIVTSKMMDSIKFKEEQAKQSLDNLHVKYNELLKEIQERTSLQEQYDYYSNIYNNRFYVKIIKEDYKNLINDIKSTEAKENELQNELNRIINEQNEIHEKTQQLDDSTYDDNLTHINYQKSIDETKLNINELSKHRFLNRKRLKEEKRKLKTFENKDNNEKIEFDSNRSTEIEKLTTKRNELETKKENVDLDLNLTDSEKRQFYKQLDMLIAKINEYFKCDSIDQIDFAIEKAKEFIDQFDNMNQECLTQLKMQAEELANKIVDQQSIIANMEEEKAFVSKRQ